MCLCWGNGNVPFGITRTENVMMLLMAVWMGGGLLLP